MASSEKQFTDALTKIKRLEQVVAAQQKEMNRLKRAIAGVLKRLDDDEAIAVWRRMMG